MKQIIGGSDLIDFPDFDLENIAARIDSGAKSSSIHASYIREVKKGDHKVLRFCLLGNRKKHYEVETYDKRTIRSSNGHSQERYVVKMKVKLFGRKFKTDFTLAHRKEMKYPVLLGRRLLRNRFVVDVSQKNLSHNQKILNQHENSGFIT